MIKVLIVEDDPMVREINEKFLAKVEGYQLVGSVGSIDEAKSFLINETPDLILLDVFFPKGKGVDLLKWIRNENIKCDAILITADRSMETVKETFRYGAVDYLIKPFDFERFKESLLQFKKRKEHMEQNDCARQETIDKYVLQDGAAINEKNNIPGTKGLNQYTYDRILDFIKSMEGKSFTAKEVAKYIGVSRITARRYLEHLEINNIVELELEYGKVGRPRNKYKLKKD